MNAIPLILLIVVALLTVLGLLVRIERKVNLIMATEQQVKDSLNKIDAATTAIAANLATEADVISAISAEIDALESALQAAGVSQALVDQASELSTRTQAASDALAAQVPVLQQIAAKGVLNPVPVPVPVPPAPPV